MNKKIVFFDIDGTLSDEKTSTVPNSTIEAIHQAQENGHILIVNTGRPVATIEQNITSIGFDGYICGCGTYIEYKNNILLHATLDETIRREVVRQAFQCRVQAVLEGIEGAFFPYIVTHPLITTFKERYEQQGLPTGIYKNNELIEFDKMAVWYDENSDIETFKNFLKKYFEIIQRDKDFIEVVPLGYSKATGIQHLIDNLNLDLDDTISIGDSTNDLSMLEYTKESIAMGDSNPILFDKVTYITSDVDKDGIQNALKHFKLI